MGSILLLFAGIIFGTLVSPPFLSGNINRHVEWCLALSTPMFVCHAVEFVAKAEDGCIHLLTEPLILLFKLNNMHVFIAYLFIPGFLKYTRISHI